MLGEFDGTNRKPWLIRWAAAMGVTPGPEPREPDWIADLAR